MTLNHPWNGHFLAPVTLLVACAAVAPACNSSTSAGPGGADAASDASTGAGGKLGSGGGTVGTGGRASGGATSTGGTASGGASASGGAGGSSGGSSGTGGSVARPDAGDAGPGRSPDATAPEAGPGPNDVLCADAGASSSTLLVIGTDYCSSGCTTSEVAAVDVSHGCVLGRSVLGDNDTVPWGTGGRGFVVERTNGALDVLSPNGGVSRRVDLHGADGGTRPLNPHAVVFVPGTSGGGKAYVSLYDASGIAVVDVASGAVTKVIDFSSLLDPSDADGSVDPDVGFYDPGTGRVYFVLQRTDVTTSYSPPYQIACPPDPSLLVAIDPTTDTVADANGVAAGTSVALGLVAPADVALDVANRRALLVDNGCFRPEDGGTRRVLHGVESVNLDTGVATVLYVPTSQNFVSRIVLLGSTAALLQTFDDFFDTLWNQWSPSSATLGASLANVPLLAVGEGVDALLGVTLGSHGARVARYTVSTQVVTTVVASPWATAHQSVAGVALVR